MKGIFYTAIVMMLITPIVLYVALYIGTTETQLEEITTKIRGDKMASYAKSISQDLPRVLEISSKRSMGAAISYIDMNGEPLDDAEVRLKELTMNGTINGTELGILGSGAIKDWIDAVTVKGQTYGFYTNITVLDLAIKPYDSFNVLLSVNISINISDNRGMRLYRIYDEELVISIEGLYDPLYSLETSGYLKRRIINAGIVNGGADLDNVVKSDLYVNSSDGASFLDRLEGSLLTSARYSAMTPNQIGLETIVYPNEISAATGKPIRSTQSTVDYLYFNASSHTGYLVNETAIDYDWPDGWLRIDQEHANIYSVQVVT